MKTIHARLAGRRGLLKGVGAMAAAGAVGMPAIVKGQGGTIKIGVPTIQSGRVALVAEHFFAGRNVMLDHGLGLFTLYFHLTEARVAPSESVEGGQVIGTVGATGRVTGPHLHFAVLLGGARVDPEALLHLVPPEERPP